MRRATGLTVTGLTPTPTPTATATATGAVALAAWEGTLGHADSAAHWSVLAVIALAIGTAFVAGRHRQRATSRAWARSGVASLATLLTGDERPFAPQVVGTTAWVVLVAATIGWDLNSFAHQAHDLPTLSRLIGDVTRHEWGRALIFLAWLGLGACAALGWRRPRPGMPSEGS